MNYSNEMTTNRFILHTSSRVYRRLIRRCKAASVRDAFIAKTDENQSFDSVPLKCYRDFFCLIKPPPYDV